MLQLKSIKKDYKIGQNIVQALKDITVNFRKHEFVTILGESGCGKSTLLNVIGGLDTATSGDLLIDGKSIKNFKKKDYDSYRNKSIGFIFQSYNLINHMTVFDNIAMGMTLNGKSKAYKNKKVNELLEKVGLQDQAHKKPNQMSGGQQQRVAIARALANDPDIILADEPTGALDSITSNEIMELIKTIAVEKLVIMVTHSEKIAKEYSNRIINLKDGLIINDSNEFIYESEQDKYHVKKTAMNYITAIKLSFNNIRTKKFRTFLTSFALSIGIIGIALVMSVNTGFSEIIGKYESNELIGIPLIITNGNQNINVGISTGRVPEYKKKTIAEDEISIRRQEDLVIKEHTNVLTQEFVDYLQDMDKDIYKRLFLEYGVKYNILTKNYKNEVIKINSGTEGFVTGYTQTLNFSSLDFNDKNQLENYYKLIDGKLPKDYTEVVLVVKPNRQLSETISSSLGLDTTKNIKFSDVIGKEFYIPTNDDFYKITNGSVLNNEDYSSYINNSSTIKLTITGILIEKVEGQSSGYDIITHYNLEKEVLAKSVSSEVCDLIKTSNKDIFTNNPYLLASDKETSLYSNGCIKDIPQSISISFESVKDKEAIKEYIDSYNENKSDKDKIEYLDIAKSLIDTLGNIINVISIALIIFASISLVVSSIMIGIIMYISVLERTKEIGVLRALGARQKDIKRVFSSECIITGTIAGITAIIATILLNNVINIIVTKYEPSFDKIAQLEVTTAVGLIVLSIIITLIGGIIPAIIASRKNPVESLRSE